MHESPRIRWSLLAALLALAGGLVGLPAEPARGREAPEVKQCRARLEVQRTEGADGCWIDERVTGEPGLLQYPCAGGEAVARFKHGDYLGNVSEGYVSVGLDTRFHFSDGCEWSSQQLITGLLAQGQLRYTYTETPLPGQSGCARSCIAYATVKVLPAKR